MRTSDARNDDLEKLNECLGICRIEDEDAHFIRECSQPGPQHSYDGCECSVYLSNDI
jgi:hypothetical protein